MKPILRVCARCEWVYKTENECPKCRFASYSAHWVYGKSAYKYALTQRPWKNKKLAEYEINLNREISEAIKLFQGGKK